MSYPELAATTLAAAALIVTALGVMVALMALVGRSQIIAEAKKVAENRVREFLGDDGKPSDELRGILADRVDEVLLTDKDLHKILTERVDEIILKHAEMRLTGDGTQSSENEDNGNEDWGDPDSEYGDDR